MGIKVCKFGGTSMADGNIIRSVAKIVNSDEDRRYVVVSAPGKRFSGDIKVTDLLYECSDEAATGMKRSEVFSKIRTRFLSIEKEIGMDIGLEAMLDEIEWNIVSGAGKDYCASRGEYLSGRIMAAVLGVPFVDAADVIQFKADGTLDESTYSLMASVLKKYPRAVIPGFYGKGADGKIKTFSRGGSDITGAIVARAVKASLYENWTDVSGFFACDPRIVPSAKCIKELSYQELRELSYMGANVLHSDSIFPVKAAGIPIRIRNTFRPQDEGTLIVDSDVRNPEGNVVTGIAGKKDFTVILLEKSMMNAEVGFAANVLKVLCRHGISFEHLPSGIDTMSVVIENKYLEEVSLDDILQEIRDAVHPDYIHTRESVALVATDGHGMAESVGTSGRLFKALSDAEINVIMIDQGSSELNIIVGVDNEDCAACIRAIYREFFG